MDGTGNSGGVITHKVKVNMFYNGHIKRVQMNTCELGKINMILGILIMVS